MTSYFYDKAIVSANIKTNDLICSTKSELL